MHRSARDRSKLMSEGHFRFLRVSDPLPPPPPPSSGKLDIWDINFERSPMNFFNLIAVHARGIIPVKASGRNMQPNVRCEVRTRMCEMTAEPREIVRFGGCAFIRTGIPPLIFGSDTIIVINTL